MTNKEAYDILIGCHITEATPSCREVEDALIVALNALKQQSIFEQVKWERDVAIAQLEENGLSLGEASRKSEWIPCSERLPDDRRNVLVTAYWHETYKVMEACYYGEGVWWCCPYNNLGEHMQKLKPIAWCEKPKPYKGNKDEN